MGYASKYYDKQKAHEYYEKYRKKGILKGRGNGTQDEAQRKRQSTADLNDNGKDVAIMVKAQINEELKAALKGVKKGDTAKREAIKAQFKEKYLQELDKIKQDNDYKKPPKVKKAKGGGSKSGGSSSNDEAKKKADEKKAKKAKRKKAIANLKKQLSNLQSLFDRVSPQNREAARQELEKIQKKLQRLRKK